MAREGSGTAWLPDTTPMYAAHWQRGDWQLMAHGNGYLQWLHESGNRGDDQFGSINWLMGMAHRDLGSGRVMFRGMFSAEPWTIRGCGYPDLLASGEPVSTAWPSARDGLLALDRNGNGRIDDGTELFGESTAGRERSDGFAALAELDANGDGILDRRDPGFAHLVVWRDRNRDGKSTPEELASLDEVGVRSLDVLPARIHGDAVFDPKGNRIPLVASFERADGSRARLVDAFFRYRPR